MKLQKAHYIVSTEGTADHAFFERTADYPQRTGGRLPAVCHITRLHICMHSARGQSSMITAFQTVAMRLESIQERQCLCCSAECV